MGPFRCARRGAPFATPPAGISPWYFEIIFGLGLETGCRFWWLDVHEFLLEAMDGGEENYQHTLQESLSASMELECRGEDSLFLTRVTQGSKGRQHATVGIVGVPAAWIREQEDRHTDQSGGLKTQ